MSHKIQYIFLVVGLQWSIIWSSMNEFYKFLKIIAMWFN